MIELAEAKRIERLNLSIQFSFFRISSTSWASWPVNVRMIWRKILMPPSTFAIATWTTLSFQSMSKSSLRFHFSDRFRQMDYYTEIKRLNKGVNSSLKLLFFGNSRMSEKFSFSIRPLAEYLDFSLKRVIVISKVKREHSSLSNLYLKGITVGSVQKGLL